MNSPSREWCEWWLDAHFNVVSDLAPDSNPIYVVYYRCQALPQHDVRMVKTLSFGTPSTASFLSGSVRGRLSTVAAATDST
jgi:hypothetical protein